jgi:molecular chaperone GrpE
MKEKKEEEGIKINVSQEEPGTKDEEKEPETKEKPLAKMTKPELLEKIKELQEESTKNFYLYLRSQADIENIKKRNKKDKEDWIRYSNETLIKEMLPVIDNLEKAISHSQDENSFDALKEGVKLTLKGFIDTLVKSGLEEVKAQGEPFDPSYHQAVSQQEDNNVEVGIILVELQRGYTLNERLIRPAMVVVSKGKSDNVSSHD